MKKLSDLFLIAGSLLILLSLIFAVSNHITETNAKKASLIALAEIEEYIENNTSNPKQAPVFEQYPDMEMPAVITDNVSYIGIVSIPAISVTLPVISEWSLEHYKKAPCRYTGTAYRPGFVLSAHNYQSHFGSLRLLQQGDTVIFTDIPGNRFEYRVDHTEILTPQDIKAMISPDYDLTLFTCTPGGGSRVAVRCSKIKTESIT